MYLSDWYIISSDVCTIFSRAKVKSLSTSVLSMAGGIKSNRTALDWFPSDEIRLPLNEVNCSGFIVGRISDEDVAQESTVLVLFF